MFSNHSKMKFEMSNRKKIKSMDRFLEIKLHA